MIWDSLRVFDPLRFRIQHVVEFLVHLLQAVLQLVLMPLAVLEVSEVGVRVVPVLLILLEELQPVDVSISDLVRLQVLPRVHREEVFHVQLFGGLVESFLLAMGLDQQQGRRQVHLSG